MPPTGNLAHNPGMSHDGELNQQPFSLQAGAQSTEPHQPGLKILPIFERWDVTFFRKAFQISSTRNVTCGHLYYIYHILNFIIGICVQSLSLLLNYNFCDDRIMADLAFNHPCC